MFHGKIAIPLKLFLISALKSCNYPDKWKIANGVPVYKKESKNILRNYRAISLLPVCGEKNICIYLYIYIFIYLYIYIFIIFLTLTLINNELRQSIRICIFILGSRPVSIK